MCCVFLRVSGVQMRLVKNDSVTGWQVSWEALHRFITGWQSGALQGMAVRGNASGLLINILSPPFSYSQTWHSGWPGPPPRPPRRKLSSWTISQHLVARKTVCLFSHGENGEKKAGVSWPSRGIWYGVCIEQQESLFLFLCANTVPHSTSLFTMRQTVTREVCNIAVSIT